jgi:hypothetical protein
MICSFLNCLGIVLLGRSDCESWGTQLERHSMMPVSLAAHTLIATEDGRRRCHELRTNRVGDRSANNLVGGFYRRGIQVPAAGD